MHGGRRVRVLYGIVGEGWPIGDEDVTYGMLFCLIGVVIICSVWVVRSMSKKRWLMSTGYGCPCMVHSGQLMSGRLRSPPTQST